MATVDIIEAAEGDRISIHTTLAGGDPKKGDGPHETDISIHTTLAGGDKRFISMLSRLSISIHTTLAGGDYGTFGRLDL